MNQNEKSENEFKDIERYMNSYFVEFPEEEDIDNTINILRTYVPPKVKKTNKRFSRFKSLLNGALSEIEFMSKMYWVGSLLLFIIAYVFITVHDKNPYILVVSIAPMPFVLGLIDVFRGREEGVWEVEAACKISVQEIVISRLFLISIYNVLLNLIFTALLSIFTNILKDISIIKLTLLWSAPFCIVSGIALCIAVKIRDKYISMWVISVYIVSMVSVLSDKRVLNKLIVVNDFIYLGIALVGILIAGFQLKKFCAHAEYTEN